MRRCLGRGPKRASALVSRSPLFYIYPILFYREVALLLWGGMFGRLVKSSASLFGEENKKTVKEPHEAFVRAGSPWKKGCG